MKKIEAIIRQEKLEDVRLALEAAGCRGITVSEVQGHGQQGGVVQQWRGDSYKVSLLPKMKIEAVVKDVDVDKIAKVIIDAGKTGEVGDGKIFVYSIESAYKIRTGEKGEGVI